MNPAFRRLPPLGGEVAIDSAPGRGARIAIALQVADARAGPVNVESAALAPGSETILVVDDDPDVRQIIVGVLSDIGYRILEAGSGEAALQTLEAHRANLVVLDYAMPGVNGAEVAAQIKQTDQRQKILFVSGYADVAAIRKAVGKAALLRKPFRPAELAEAVRAALDAPV